MDMFVVPTISFRLLYGLMIMGHGRRQILWFGVTAHPTAEWIANQITEACGWEQAPRYLIRDRDGACGEVFIRRLRSIGIRDRPKSPRRAMRPDFAPITSQSIMRHTGARPATYPVVWRHSASDRSWIANQITEACGWEQAPRYLIRDRDGAYGEVFIRRLRSMGIRDRPTSPRSPWQNGYAERLIGSIRRECLDHVIVFSERHLRHLLLSYMRYYNEMRTHLSMEKDAPVPRAVERAGHIDCRPVLGGLHHQYVRI